jgi:hypothetical protein
MMALSRNETVLSINRGLWSPEIAVRDFSGDCIGRLLPINIGLLDDSALIEAMTRWRRNRAESFATQFVPTAQRTRSWLEKVVLNDDRRLLFIIYHHDNPIGHLGLRDLNETSFQGDNLVRGERGGGFFLMKHASWAFQAWAMQCFQVRQSWGRVLANNSAAISFNLSLGNVVDVPSETVAAPHLPPTERDGVNSGDKAMIQMTLTWDNLLRAAPEAVVREFMQPILPPVH